jgi:ACS family hexuronate transporter-like MFS transporter
MMFVSLISYIDRNTLALLAPTILRETHLNAEQYGFIISAFSIAYMIGNPVWGILLDRIGLAVGMSVAVFFWSAASGAHAFASGFYTFAAARALLGFGEGSTFPGALRTAIQTLPAVNRSRGIAVAYSGGSLGAIVTPIIVTPIAARYGWRAAFLMTGLVGLVWLAGWLFVSRDLQKPSPSTEGSKPKLTDGRLWAFMAAYAMGGLPLAFVIYGAAIYLNQARGLSQITIGALLWIPPLGWELGYFFWGWVTDRFHLKGGIPYDRLLMAAMLLSLPLAVTSWAPAVPLVMFQLFFAMFVAAGFVILAIAYATDVFSSRNAGLIAGIGAGSWSAVVALVMPLFGRLFDQHRYEAAFTLAAVFPVAGYALWRVMDRWQPSRI